MRRLRKVREGERSAGVVVVRHAPEGWRFLILRAYRNWDFPKGLIEPDEDPLAAAVRETREEAGIEDLAFPWGHVFRETAPYARAKVARYYLAETRQERIALPINPALGRAEHHESRWVGPEAARRLLPPRLQPILAWARSLLEA